ncbi:PqqD family protein, partial [Nostoc sp. NIES-2111]
RIGVIRHPETRYKALPDVVACDRGGEAALLDLRTSRYFGLNAVGSLVWTSLSEPASPNVLAEIVASRFEVEKPRAEADIRALLDQLEAEGLVTRVEADA